MIKMIAMDFDWTIADHTKGSDIISIELIDYLNNFINKGNYAGIVSGRVYWDFQREFDAAGVEWANPFPNYVIGREAYFYEVTKDDYIDHPKINVPANKRITNLNRKLSKYLDDILTIYEDNHIKVVRFFIYGDFAVEIHVENKDAQHAMELTKKFVTDLEIDEAAVHRNGTLITIYHKMSGKGNALLEASKELGLKPSEVLAIGDNYNDITMIDGKLGFIGGCVGNADDNIKNIVRSGGGYVGNGTAHKGILDIIKQIEIKGLI